MLDLAYIRQNAMEMAKQHKPCWIPPERVLAMLDEIERLRARLGIVISALRQFEEATGESLDDEGGDIAGIETELRADRKSVV